MRLKKNAAPFDQTQPQTQQFEGQNQPQPLKESRMVLFFCLFQSSKRSNEACTRNEACTQKALTRSYNRNTGPVACRKDTYHPIIYNSTDWIIYCLLSKLVHLQPIASIRYQLTVTMAGLPIPTAGHHLFPFPCVTFWPSGLLRWVTAVTIPPGLQSLLNLSKSRLSVYLVYHARLISSFDLTSIFCRRPPSHRRL